MRNEIFAADARSNRSHRPIEIVAPERDTPGARASAWAVPMSHASRRWNSSVGRAPAKPSAHCSTSAKRIRLIPMRIGSPRLSSITLVNRAPMTAPGMAVSRSNHAIRSSTVVIDRVRSECQAATMYDHTSCRKYASTATSVPTCSATSNVLFNESFDVSSVHPNSSGRMIRCPLEEMGKNSENPCTIPRMMAWSTDKCADATGAWRPRAGRARA